MTMPKGNCRFKMGLFKTGNFVKPRFHCSELHRLNYHTLPRVNSQFVHILCHDWSFHVASFS